MGETRNTYIFLVSKSKGISAPYICRLYPPFQGDIPVNHFCWRLTRLQGHTAAGKMKSKKIPNNPNGNRTRELTVYSAVLFKLNRSKTLRAKFVAP